MNSFCGRWDKIQQIYDGWERLGSGSSTREPKSTLRQPFASTHFMRQRSHQLLFKTYGSWTDLSRSADYLQADGIYQMIGPAVVLVDRISATHGRPWQDDNSVAMPIHATHSEMAKFKSIEDGVYRDNVVSWLKDVLERNQSSQ